MAERTCSIDGCDKPAKQRGWCKPHYMRWWRYGDPLRVKPTCEPPTCAVSGCEKIAKARGWCPMHYARWRKHGDVETVVTIMGDHERRFWSKVDKNGPVPARHSELGPCWLWTASGNIWGYGHFSVRLQTISAHRFAYETQGTPIPDGMEIDHLCDVRRCVNPRHLRVLTPRANTLRAFGSPSAENVRKTECVNGHPFNEANTYFRPTGGRSCRACMRLRMQRKRARS